MSGCAGRGVAVRYVVPSVVATVLVAAAVSWGWWFYFNDPTQS
jgi:hypothetical protein